MSTEKANKKRDTDGEMNGALHGMSKEELLEENERLRAQVSELRKMLTQAEKQSTQESTIQDEPGRKRRRITRPGGHRVSQRDDNDETAVERGQKHAPKDDPQEKDSTVQDITELPSALLGHALQYLTFLETRFFFGCGNRVLWEERRVDYDSQMAHDLVLPARPPYAFLHGNLMNVWSLDLGPWCSDIILALMCDERILPNLKHLAMARSIDVTNEGLALLTQNPARCRKLKTLDLQFCRRISYERTLDIREKFDALDVLRRQPPWMDGMQTFLDGDMYKAWADGSYVHFDKGGKLKECGYFCDMYESGSKNFVVQKVQAAFDYLREDNDSSQFEWQYHASRCGITMLRLPDAGHVLETDPNVGRYPLNDFPHPEHADLVPVGCQRAFDRQGLECNSGDPQAYAIMKKYNLQPLDVLMPPSNVIEMCRNQLNDMHRALMGRDQEADEREIHFLRGGDEDDEPPPEWFQYYP